MVVEIIEAPRPIATLVVFDGSEDPRPPAPLAVAAAEPLSAAQKGRLPLGRLGGLAASGAFAFWTSLTCFVC